MQSKQAVELVVCCRADDTTCSTPAVNAGLGVHGESIQSHGGGQMPTGGLMTTPDFWLPVLTPPSSMAHPQDSRDLALAQQYQDLVVAQAAGSPRAASPATAGASSIPMASLGPTAAPVASSAVSVAAAESSAGPAQQDQAPAVAQAAPTTVAATNGIAICLLLCPVSFQQGHLLMTCKLLRGLMSLCKMHAH